MIYDILFLKGKSNIQQNFLFFYLSSHLKQAARFHTIEEKMLQFYSKAL